MAVLAAYHSGLTEALGPGPSTCGGGCDWVYLFDVCGGTRTYGAIPGRLGGSSCLFSTTSCAIRIEDEAPGISPVCEDLGAQCATIDYVKTEGGGLAVEYTSATARSLTVELECDPGAGPVTAENGSPPNQGGPNRAAEVYNNGVATLTWRTRAVCVGGGLGWAIVWIIKGAGCVYLLGGVAYGRRTYPPLAGDGAFAHPDGLGVIGWHPVSPLA